MKNQHIAVSDDAVTASLFTAADKLVASPWAFTLEEKLAIVEGLITSDSREGLQFLRQLLNFVEVPLRTSDSSAKYGGPVLNAVTAGIARMTIVGALEVLEDAYLNEGAEPLLRASVVWGLRLNNSQRGRELIYDGLKNPSSAIAAAALDAMQFKLRQAPRRFSFEDRIRSASSAVLLYLTTEIRDYKLSAVRILEILPLDLVCEVMEAKVSGTSNYHGLSRAVELGSKLTGEAAELFLVGLLKRKDLPRGLYEALTFTLKETVYQSVREEIRVLAEGPTFSEWCKGVFDSSTRDRLRLRTHAARLM